MAFQDTIYTKQALGKPGTISRLNPIDKIPVIAEGDAVVAGGFVFEGTNPETQVIGCSSATSSKTADDVAGVAVFEQFQATLNGIAGINTLKVNEGENVVKVRKGYVYVKSTTASTHGDAVYVDPATGDIKAASSAVSDYIDTGWKVETGNAAGQVCEIYKI